MKFFEYLNRLGVIAIEPDAIAATVIGNATDILYLMLPKNTPCLAGAGGTEQIVNFQFPELLGKRFVFQIIPQWSIFCVWRQKLATIPKSALFFLNHFQKACVTSS